MTTLVDTNVILDVIVEDPTWAEWSTRQMKAAADRGEVVVSDIIYAELCARYDSLAEVDGFLSLAAFRLVRPTAPALFAAGQAHRRYRARGGPRLTLLPDFIIGAHAFVETWTLLSRDPRCHRTDFPGLDVICP